MRAYAIEVLKKNGTPYVERIFVEQEQHDCKHIYRRSYDRLTLATSRRERDWLFAKASAYMRDDKLRVVQVTIGGPVKMQIPKQKPKRYYAGVVVPRHIDLEGHLIPLKEGGQVLTLEGGKLKKPGRTERKGRK